MNTWDPLLDRFFMNHRNYSSTLFYIEDSQLTESKFTIGWLNGMHIQPVQNTKIYVKIIFYLKLLIGHIPHLINV